MLLSYGGHRYAAGISIEEKNIKEFSSRFNKITGDDLTASDLTPQTIIDAQCNLKEIDHDLISHLDMLAPFGNMNPEPVLCARNMRVISPAIVGNNHLRMGISGDGTSCNSIWFSKGHLAETLAESTFDIAFTPQINHWNGASKIQLKMKDMAFVRF
jgi:single-stranded-DNA-specific exonuclease